MQWALKYAVHSRYALCNFSAKRSNPHSGVCSRYAVGTQSTVGTFSAIRSNLHSGVHSRYTVCSRCWCKKVNSHSGFSKYGWWGPLPLVQKGQTHTVGYAVGTQYTVGMQYAVDVSAERSNYTVELVNVGGGDHYL